MNNINIETETDQNFFNECEQAILDRDEKIKNLLNDLSIQNVRTQQQNQLEKIESSICNTQKMFLHLKVWFKQFEEKKLAKSSKINGNLKEENECLKNQNQILSEEKRKNNEKIQFFVHGLKSQISTLKKELNDVKTQQNSNSNDFVKLLIKHKQFSLMESNKYISTQDSETNKSYDIMSLVTPHKKYSEKEMLSGFATKIKKKNVSTNTQFNDQTHRISYNRNHSLKEEYGRKSIIIQCILKNLSKKKNLKQLRDSWLKKVKSLILFVIIVIK